MDVVCIRVLHECIQKGNLIIDNLHITQCVHTLIYLLHAYVHTYVLTSTYIIHTYIVYTNLFAYLVLRYFRLISPGKLKGQPKNFETKTKMN